MGRSAIIRKLELAYCYKPGPIRQGLATNYLTQPGTR
jgi:hypothetical protein